VTVTSNAVNAPSLALELSLEIVVDVEVSPPRLSFAELRKGEKATLSFIVKISDPAKYKLGGLHLDDARFALVDKGELNYELQFKGSSVLENLSSKLLIEVQGERNRTLEVPISVRVVGDIIYTRNLYFLKRNDVLQAKEIALSSRSGRAIKVLGASDPEGRVKVTIPKQPAKELVLKVEVERPGDNFKKPQRGTITVRTSDKDMAEIPVSYTISEARAPVVSMGSKAKPPPVRVVPSMAPEATPSAPQKDERK
jgi:hypothetical protein